MNENVYFGNYVPLSLRKLSLFIRSDYADPGHSVPLYVPFWWPMLISIPERMSQSWISWLLLLQEFIFSTKVNLDRSKMSIPVRQWIWSDVNNPELKNLQNPSKSMDLGPILDFKRDGGFTRAVIDFQDRFTGWHLTRPNCKKYHIFMLARRVPNKPLWDLDCNCLQEHMRNPNDV